MTAGGAFPCRIALRFHRRFSVVVAVRVLRPRCPCRAPASGLAVAPLTPFGESGCRGRACSPCRGTSPLRWLQPRPLCFFFGSRFELRPARKAVSPRCGGPRFARLSVCSNARQSQTFFIGWRVVLHCGLDHNYTCGSLRAGAVCPPRAPPECFSWFCFGSANCPLNPQFCPYALIGPRRGPLGPDAGRTPTP